MIPASAALPPRCRTNGADPFLEVTQKCAELRGKRSAVPLSRRLTGEVRHTRPQVLASEEPTSAWEVAACSVRPLRVLLVDDNRYLAELLAVLLRSAGHHVQVAYDGLAALECVRAYRPEVVLLDIHLPGISGYEVASRLRAREDTKHLFLAALTGDGLKDGFDQSRETDFDCHLAKPLEPRVLRRLLASVANGDRCVLGKTCRTAFPSE